jgi:cobalamin biosynthesis Mg chelatase CobN
MAEESAALSTTAPAATDGRDYETIFATIMESARGRAFLDEYARRNRHADTAQVVDAIGRLEALFRERSREDDRHLRKELAEMARVIADLRSEDAHDAQRLPAAHGYLERRINAMLTLLQAVEKAPSVALTTREAPPALSLSDVRRPEAEMLAANHTQQAVSAAHSQTPAGNANPVLAAPSPVPASSTAPGDPLAGLKALSDEERIALFT